jgi:regulator of protease activity HflC (stomatin/prohibitin superfamily)
MEILGSIGIVGAIILVLVAIFVLSGFRIVNQYERGVIFVLGRLRGAKGPGLFWVPPFITQMRRLTCVSSPSSCRRKGRYATTSR